MFCFTKTILIHNIDISFKFRSLLDAKQAKALPSRIIDNQAYKKIDQARASLKTLAQRIKKEKEIQKEKKEERIRKTKDH